MQKQDIIVLQETKMRSEQYTSGLINICLQRKQTGNEVHHQQETLQKRICLTCFMLVLTVESCKITFTKYFVLPFLYFFIFLAALNIFFNLYAVVCIFFLVQKDYTGNALRNAILIY